MNPTRRSFWCWFAGAASLVVAPKMAFSALDPDAGLAATQQAITQWLAVLGQHREIIDRDALRDRAGASLVNYQISNQLMRVKGSYLSGEAAHQSVRHLAPTPRQAWEDIRPRLEQLTTSIKGPICILAGPEVKYHSLVSPDGGWKSYAHILA